MGRTTHKTVDRQEYIPMADVLAELEQKLANGPVPNHVPLCGAGEPTLNEGIGQLIAEIKKFTYIPIAVLTNGSLLWRSEVQDALMKADLVLPSLDAGDEFLIRYVNRPHREITFDQVVHCIAEFTRRFPKPVWLEVSLLAGVTGILAEVEKIAALAKEIQPQRVQLNTVSRPACEEFACPVSRNQVKEFANVFGGKAELISEDNKSRDIILREATDADIPAL
jgi:wyosine [tRNA(Phe)-imidazoG37] synthetase (radical SAM superfamily)